MKCNLASPCGPTGTAWYLWTKATLPSRIQCRIKYTAPLYCDLGISSYDELLSNLSISAYQRGSSQAASEQQHHTSVPSGRFRRVPTTTGRGQEPILTDLESHHTPGTNNATNYWNIEKKVSIPFWVEFYWKKMSIRMCPYSLKAFNCCHLK